MLSRDLSVSAGLTSGAKVVVVMNILPYNLTHCRCLSLKHESIHWTLPITIYVIRLHGKAWLLSVFSFEVVLLFRGDRSS